MKAFNSLEKVTPETIADHEQRTGTNVEQKAQYRAQHLDLNYKVAPGADEKGSHLEVVFTEVLHGTPSEMRRVT
jgi:hypothetical protein